MTSSEERPDTGRWAQTTLLAIGATLLCLPLLLVGKPGTLDGATVTAARPRLSWEGWKSGRLQRATEAWFQQEMGLREVLVRSTNQLCHDLFGMSYMGGQSVIIGKHGQLFPRGGIDRYCNTLEPEKLAIGEANARRARELQDLLAAEGVPFVILFTPIKSSIYPQDLPDVFCAHTPKPGPEAATGAAALVAHGVATIDAIALTREAQARHGSTRLFARCGLHWNGLGAYYTSRAVLEWIREHTGLVQGPSLSLDGYRSVGARNTMDVDLGELLNLWSLPEGCETVLPRLSSTRGERPLSVMIVGGSFLHLPLAQMASTGAFERLDFYFYLRRALKHVVQGREESPVDMGGTDWRKELLRSDVVILEANAGGLAQKHVTAFLDTALEALTPASK